MSKSLVCAQFNVSKYIFRIFSSFFLFQSHAQRRNETMSMSNRSQSAAPRSYVGERRGSLSPPDDRYLTSSADYPNLPIQQQQSAYTPQFKSRSATATPTGSPKKRQLPKVPQIQRNSAVTTRERLMQDFEERSLGRRSRGMRHHIPQYRSTAHGGESDEKTVFCILLILICSLRLGTILGSVR